MISGRWMRPVVANAFTGELGRSFASNVPAMVGDPDTWQETSSQTYCSRGRAYQLGLQTVQADLERLLTF